MKTKNIIALLVMILPALPLCGQGAKRINEIKRDSRYIYAESTMPEASDAYELAKSLLVNYAKDYAVENGIGGDYYGESNVLAQCDSIQLNRGDKTKVFVYFMKAEVSGLASKPGTEPAKAPVQEEPRVQNQPPVPVQGTPVERPAPPAPPVPAPAEPKKSEPASVKVTSSSASGMLPEAWQRKVIDELLSSSSFAEARGKLPRMKQEFQVKRFGRYAECKDVSKAFWLVGDSSGKLVTVLGPGGIRTDFRSGATASLDSYNGYELIWFTLYTNK
ncbi:MAG: hypothetical protein IJS66_03450 [Bacteroidales bacterium]|nr:hypothetical protein [Bacteroidales bacterium]